MVIADYLFPIYCLACDTDEGDWLCAACRVRQNVSGVFDCPACHMPTLLGYACAGCVDRSSLVSVCAAVPYGEKRLSGRLVRAVKFGFATEAGELFDERIAAFVRAYPAALAGVDSIVPVPLHPRRFAERGFNQAEMIADYLAYRTGIPRLHALARRRYTERQMTLSRERRKTNVLGAFAVAPTADILGKKVLIVDDVYTTGATMQECARILLAAGAKECAGFAFARG